MGQSQRAFEDKSSFVLVSIRLTDFIARLNNRFADVGVHVFYFPGIHVFLHEYLYEGGREFDSLLSIRYVGIYYRPDF